MYHGPKQPPGQVNISDSTFDGNSGAGLGGAVFASNMITAISGSRFIGNKARNSLGGAIYFTSSFNETTLNMSKSTFKGNGQLNETSGETIPNDLDLRVAKFSRPPRVPLNIDFNPMCAGKPQNCFCDADPSLGPSIIEDGGVLVGFSVISTVEYVVPDTFPNDASLFCSGAGVGPQCPFCLGLPDVLSCPAPSPARHRALSDEPDDAEMTPDELNAYVLEKAEEELAFSLEEEEVQSRLSVL